MQALTFFFAFVAVLVLIGVVAWLVRRFAGNRLGGNANRGRMPRLAVIDAAAVDGRRRLVLVRRDNVEHLLMIGGPTDIVVEPNIVRATPSRDQISPRPSLGTELPRGAPLPDAGGWTEEEAPRLEAPEPAPPPPPPAPVRPSRPSFADELRRAPPPPLEHRHDPLATIAPEPVTRPEPRPDLRAEPAVPRASTRTEPQIPRAPLPPLRSPEPPVTKAPPVRSVEPPAAPVPPAAAQASTADQNLAEMAKRLEAALRRPAGERSTAPEPRVTAPAAAPDAAPVRPAPRINVNAPASTEPSAAPPVAPPPPKGDFENLEDEMASLLGRPKTPS
jgi:hypothetical protein